MGSLRRFFGRESAVEERLRAQRPRPSARLRAELMASLPGASRRGAHPHLRVAALSGAIVLGLLAIGGLGYAATYTNRIVSFITSDTFLVKKTSLRVIVRNSAQDQYSTTTTATTTTTTTTTTTSTTATTTVAAGQSATITLNVGGATVVGAFGSGAFSASTSVSVSAAKATGVPLDGSGNVAFTVTATANGSTPIHTLGDVVTFQVAAPCDYLPAVYENGGWRPLEQISTSSPTLGDLNPTTHDAYYAGGCVSGIRQFFIFTGHLSTFGVVAPQNISVSDTGRKLAPANSGRWGDAARVHAGPPTLRITTKPTVSGNVVKFAFFVDEQAAVYLHVLANGNKVNLLATSTLRGHQHGGKTARTLHVPILRPGTIPVGLHLGAHHGPLTVEVSAVDFDGNTVTRTVKVH